MSPSDHHWLTRELQFAAFTTGPLLDFWHSREEGEFNGVDNIPIRYVRFCSSHHRKLIVILPGRIESYVKYAEVAYDLYHCGYDIMVIDHRGQGRSGRMLADTQRGHVQFFDDYVTDLERFYQHVVVPGAYQYTFALAHSMGAAILALFMARHRQVFTASVWCAPMLGIYLPMPHWLAQGIINVAERYPRWREAYVIGTGRWRALPFAMNCLTHSVERYQRNQRLYTDDVALQLGGPTYHWLQQGVLAGQRILAQANAITTPTLLLQAGEDRVVRNEAQDIFCRALMDAGHPCAGGKPHIIYGARHEILFEKDALRAEALEAITHFFTHRSKPSPV